MTQYTGPGSTTHYTAPNTLMCLISKGLGFFSEIHSWDSVNSEQHENRRQPNTIFLKTFKGTVSKTGLEL